MKLFFTFFLFLINAANSLAIECERPYSSLVFKENNNEIIFEMRAEEVIYPASLTKIMTLYLTFEALQKKHLKLEQVLKVSPNVEDVSHINKINTLNLKEGDKITVEQAIKGTVIKSFNETAVALAEAIAGSEWEFAQMMNKKAQELNMTRTNFRNASGFHEAGQYTTSYDLARLTRAIEKKFPQYRKYFAMKEFTFNGTKYKTTNHVLLEYKGANGFKTGFTNASGFNLIASAKRGNVGVKSILTGCESYQTRDEFTKNLLDLAFEYNHKKPDIEVKIK